MTQRQFELRVLVPITTGMIVSLIIMAISFFDSPREIYYSIVAHLLSGAVIALTFTVNLFYR